jgi:hypothetical protein
MGNMPPYVGLNMLKLDGNGWVSDDEGRPVRLHEFK